MDHYLQMISTGGSQGEILLQHATSQQITKLKKIARDVLKGKVHLSTLVDKKLGSERKFIRRLADTQVKGKYLKQNIKTVQLLVKTSLKNEIDEKSCPRSLGGMGKDKRKKPPSARHIGGSTPERKRAEKCDISSESSSSSSVWNSFTNIIDNGQENITSKRTTNERAPEDNEERERDEKENPTNTTTNATASF